MVNEYHIRAMGLATKGRIDTIEDYALRIEQDHGRYLKDLNIEALDFKLEFGKISDGKDKYWQMRYPRTPVDFLGQRDQGEA